MFTATNFWFLILFLVLFPTIQHRHSYNYDDGDDDDDGEYYDDGDRSRQNTDQPLKTEVIIGIVIAVVSIVVIVSLILCCQFGPSSIKRFLRKIFYCCFDTPRNQNQNSTELIFVKQINIKQQINQTIDPTCSICLNDSVNVRTMCQHMFHGRCITEWYNRTETCPLCVRTIENPLQLKCLKCSCYYVEFNVHKKSNWNAIIKKIQKQNHICQEYDFKDSENHLTNKIQQ